MEQSAGQQGPYKETLSVYALSFWYLWNPEFSFFLDLVLSALLCFLSSCCGLLVCYFTPQMDFKFGASSKAKSDYNCVLHGHWRKKEKHSGECKEKSSPRSPLLTVALWCISYSAIPLLDHV